MKVHTFGVTVSDFKKKSTTQAFLNSTFSSSGMNVNGQGEYFKIYD